MQIILYVYMYVSLYVRMCEWAVCVNLNLSIYVSSPIFDAEMLSAVIASRSFTNMTATIKLLFFKKVFQMTKQCKKFPETDSLI